MEFSLIKINNDSLNILKNLFQLYIHDISKELSWNVNKNGLFEAYSLDDWFKDKNNFGYIIYVDNNIAGFIMIDKEFKVLENKPENLNLSEIFILNNFKEKGLAKNVVLKVYVKKDSQISEDEIVSNIKKIFIRDTASINTSIYPDGLNQDLTVYEFSFSTASINFETSSSFTLNISGTAKIVEEGGNTTLWIIIGVVGGVVLLGGSALIVWLIIRRKKLGKLKNRNDDYKNYYY